MKRLLDLVFSFLGLLFFSPIVFITVFSVWLYDFHNPFYTPMRMGKNMIPFKMFKFRSMVINADKSGVTSTSVSDNRITPIGNIIRKLKLDEILQLINVFRGNMSIVGPRPQVIEHVVNEYTDIEKKLLTVKPGITDISSIIFSDEGEILSDYTDPDLAYNQLIRPWKSRLGSLYIENQNTLLDFNLIFLTIIAFIAKEKALKSIGKILLKLNAGEELINISQRKEKLKVGLLV